MVSRSWGLRSSGLWVSGKRRARGVLLLLTIAGIALIPAVVGADSAGGQASAYTVPRRDAQACSIFSPQLTSDGGVLFNQSAQAGNVRLEVRALGAGARYVRDVNFGANAGRELGGRIPNLPSDLGATSFRASLVRTPVATAPPTSTPVSASTPIPPVEALDAFEIAQATGTNGSIALPTPLPACGLTAVMYDDAASGDRWAVEAFTPESAGAEVFLPLVHHANRGFNTQVIIQNVGPTDAFAEVTAYGDDGEEETTVRIKAESSLELAMEMPRGANSLIIEGAGEARLMAAAYHTGPRGMAAAEPAVSSGDSRVALPLLMRAAGNENAYTSHIRVMALADGTTPRITFRDRDSGERIGPISAARHDGSPRVMREGHGHTWDLAEMRELRDGRVYSAEIDSNSGGGLAVVVETLNTQRGILTTYTGVPSSGDLSATLVAPLVMKNRDGLSSSVQLQNLSGNPISVAVRFFNMGGRRVTTINKNILGRESATVYLPATNLPDGFVGMAEITSSGGVAAVVSTVRYR